MTQKSFNDLLKKIRLGNKRAIEELYNKLHVTIFTTAFMFLKNKGEAEDISEEVFWKIISYEGEPIQEPVGWIKRIVRNECYNYSKRFGKIDLREDMDEYHSSASTAGADKMLIFKEIMSQLSELEQTILIDHVFWGYSLKQISISCGIAYITAKRKYKEIKEKLKNFLDS